MSIKFKVHGFVMLPLDLVWAVLPVFLNQFNLRYGCVVVQHFLYLKPISRAYISLEMI